MRRIFMMVVVTLAFGLPGLAQTAADAPASKEDVQRYFHAVHSHDMMLKMMEAMSQPMHQATHEQCEKDKDKLPADCEQRINKLLDAMMKELALR